MDLQFVIQNWYLFLAIIVITALLFADPLRRRASGVQGVSVMEMTRLLNHENAVVVDVCEPAEYKKAHIPDSINVPLKGMENNLNKLEKHRKKGRPLILTCRTGQRSSKAAGLLRKREFEKLYTLNGGLGAWEKENLPIARD